MPKISIHENYARKNLKLILPTILLYVCDFSLETGHLHTRTEPHLLPVRDRHTHALSRNTKH